MCHTSESPVILDFNYLFLLQLESGNRTFMFALLKILRKFLFICFDI